MKADIPSHPALGRFFRSMTQLAIAGGMCRERLYQIKRGERNFTEQEKRAITADIMARMFAGELEQTEELNMQSLYLAYNGQFDQFFKIGGNT